MASRPLEEHPNPVVSERESLGSSVNLHTQISEQTSPHVTTSTSALQSNSISQLGNPVKYHQELKENACGLEFNSSNPLGSAERRSSASSDYIVDSHLQRPMTATQLAYELAEKKPAEIREFVEALKVSFRLCV